MRPAKAARPGGGRRASLAPAGGLREPQPADPSGSRGDGLGDSERQLALQLRTGDEAAIATLLEVQGSKVNGYLRRRFPSFDETELYDLLVGRQASSDQYINQVIEHIYR